jgi:glycosyltransferase involved in cell wall biosynthesis
VVKVLVVGQTPPPYGGQAMMIHRLVHSELDGVEVVHVRMGFSSSMGEIGRFRISKLLHLVSLVLQIVWHRVASGANVLYYPPGGPQRAPMFRDIAILSATRWMFSKSIFHFHASGIAELYDRLPSWQKWLYRRACFGVDAAVRISELTPEDGKLIQARREFIVPNGIDDPWTKPVERAGFEASAARPLRILYVGMLNEGKGLLPLIDACRGLLDRGIEFQLRLMGQPSSRAFLADLRSKIAAANLEERVQFLGVLSGPEKWQAFEQVDVLCHPTWYDTVPVVIVEAMAAALPVVSTWHSGVPSLVEHGRTGLLVAPRDSAALAECLADLATNGERRAAMGRAGRARFEQMFKIETHIERMRRVFLEVCGEPQAEVAAFAENSVGVPLTVAG